MSPLFPGIGVPWIAPSMHALGFGYRQKVAMGKSLVIVESPAKAETINKDISARTTS